MSNVIKIGLLERSYSTWTERQTDRRTDGQTDRQDEANSRFPQIFRALLKMTNTTCSPTVIPVQKCECMGNPCFV